MLSYLSTAIVHSYNVLLQNVRQLLVITDWPVDPLRRWDVQVQKVSEQKRLILKFLCGPLDLKTDDINEVIIFTVKIARVFMSLR